MLRFQSPASLPLPALLLSAVFWLSGCSTPSDLPPLDLQEDGWTVHRGQAAWERKPFSEGIAGEYIAGQRRNQGVTFAEFGTPIAPVARAREAEGRWEIQFPEVNLAFKGKGQPPSNWIWFHVPDVLSGGQPPDGWSMTKKESGSVILAREKGNEKLTLSPRAE